VILDAGLLASMETGQALAMLQTTPGLGPVYAELVELRSTGVSDALTLTEPRLGSYVRHFYGLPEVPDAPALQRIAEPWRPFRTWATVLIRVAGDRAGLPWQPGQPERPRRARAGRPSPAQPFAPD
jgi:DNA-3-methyladenine glycosylase II